LEFILYTVFFIFASGMLGVFIMGFGFSEENSVYIAAVIIIGAGVGLWLDLSANQTFYAMLAVGLLLFALIRWFIEREAKAILLSMQNNEEK